jgi:hypothetical protein
MSRRNRRTASEAFDSGENRLDSHFKSGIECFNVKMDSQVYSYTPHSMSVHSYVAMAKSIAEHRFYLPSSLVAAEALDLQRPM